MFYSGSNCEYYGDYQRSHHYGYDSRGSEGQSTYFTTGSTAAGDKLFYHHPDRTDMPVCIDVNMSMYIPYSNGKQNSAYFGTPLPVVPTTYESYGNHDSAYHSIDKSYQPQSAAAVKHWNNQPIPNGKNANWTPGVAQLHLPVKLPVQSQIITSNTDKKKSGGKRLKSDTRANPNAPKFRCDVCQKQYCRRSTLKAHVRQHSGERPYACSMCDKKFSQVILFYRIFSLFPIVFLADEQSISGS